MSNASDFDKCSGKPALLPRLAVDQNGTESPATVWLAADVEQLQHLAPREAQVLLSVPCAIEGSQGFTCQRLSNRRRLISLPEVRGVPSCLTMTVAPGPARWLIADSEQRVALLKREVICPVCPALPQGVKGVLRISLRHNVRPDT